MSNYKTATVKDIEHYADMFKALSNPNRLKIFLELLSVLPPGEVCTSNAEQVDACQLNMAKQMNLAPSTISHHMKELKNAGLVKINRVGRNVEIEIRKESLTMLKSFLDK